MKQKLPPPNLTSEPWLPAEHAAPTSYSELRDHYTLSIVAHKDGHACVRLSILDTGSRRMRPDLAVCYEAVGVGRRVLLEGLQQAVTQLLWDEWAAGE